MIGGKVTKGDAGARLKELIAQASKPETLEQAVLAGAELVAESMRDKMVRGDIPPHTQDQIGARLVDNSGTDTPRAVAGVLGDQSDVGRFNEFGTSKMTAQPWARPGYDAVRDQIGKAVGDALKKDLDL